MQELVEAYAKLVGHLHGRLVVSGVPVATFAQLGDAAPTHRSFLKACFGNVAPPALTLHPIGGDGQGGRFLVWEAASAQPVVWVSADRWYVVASSLPAFVVMMANGLRLSLDGEALVHGYRGAHLRLPRDHDVQDVVVSELDAEARKLTGIVWTLETLVRDAEALQPAFAAELGDLVT